MGWRSTLVLVALVLAVGAYLWFADAPPTPPDHAGPGQGQRPGAAPAPLMHPLLGFEPLDVVDVEVQRAGQTRSVRRQNGTWQGIEDAATVTDFLHTLSEMRVLMEITASAQELSDYGLAPPLGVLTMHVRGQTRPLVLQIGDRNPATTGVYVRLGEDGPVVLAGALVEWEFDKLFKHLGAGGS